MTRSVIIRGGRIRTLDPRHPLVEAVGIVGDTIAAVGPVAQVRRAIGSWAEAIDLKGATALPGFTDAHTHLLALGLALRQIDLSGTTSPEEAARRLAAALPGSGWIVGRDWEARLWSERQPDRELLDAVVPDRPVVAWSKDLHSLWANSSALAAAGIGSGTSAPAGGTIERRPGSGEPTGLFRENAVGLILRAMPEADLDERAEALLAGAAAARAAGLTGVHNLEDAAVFRVLQDLAPEGGLGLRVRATLPADRLDALIAVGAASGLGDAWLRLLGVKVFVDGTLGSRTAALEEPYVGHPGDRGVLVTGADELAEMVARASRHGLAVAMHAIGDRACRIALDAVVAEQAGAPRRPAGGPRVEHAQLVRDVDLGRFSQRGVVASVQPLHAVKDRAAAAVLWADRLDRAYPYRRLWDAGATLAFGSDAPIESLEPGAILAAAVARVDPDALEEGPWLPGEALGLDEAVRAYTLGPLLASGESRYGGVLEPGRWADLTILDADPWEVDATRLGRIRAVATLVGGEVRHGGENLA